MKQTNYVVRGTPIVPSVCTILMALLWYFHIIYYNGAWTTGMNEIKFAEMSGSELFVSIGNLALPVLLFIGVLFLAEIDVRWMVLPLLGSVAYQTTLFIINFFADYPEYMNDNPFSFALPYLALILFICTTEKVLKDKWIFVGFCALAVIIPLILTCCGIGEFTTQQQDYDADGNVIETVAYYWSEFLSYALTYVAMGALAAQMRPPKEGDFVSMKDLKQAYAEKMAAQAEPEPAAPAEEPAEETETEPEEVSEEADAAPEEPQAAPEA